MKTNPTTLEILEDRIAPAGLITAVYDAATGELTLTGDALANEASVFQTGTNTYRVEGIDTEINPGVTFLDIGKLTKLTINGGASDDNFDLLNLRTLKSLSFSGGSGDDTLDAFNLTVTGATDLHGNAGEDTFSFDGVSTLLKGTLTVDSAPTATDVLSVNFDAQKTEVTGVVTFTGGGGDDTLGAFGVGPATFSKGIIFNAGAGGARLDLGNDDALSVGKLATGESILFNGGDGNDTLNVEALNSTLSSGIRMTGLGGFDTIGLSQDASTLKIGKLATGQSILFDGGTGDDRISAAGVFNANLSGGIELIGGDGDNTIDLASPGGVLKVGKLSTGESVKFTGTTGDDSFSASSTNLSFSGGVILDAGAGNNSIDIGGVSGKSVIGKTATGVSLGLTGLANSDTISTDVADLNLAGGIVLNGGDGTNRVDVFGTGAKATIGKTAAGQSIFATGGTGSDTINTTVSNLTLNGGIEFTAGAGTNRIDLDNAGNILKLGKLATGESVKQTGTTGIDSFNANGANVSFAGGVILDAGAGNNFLDIGAGSGKSVIGKTPEGVSLGLTGLANGDSISTNVADLTLHGGIVLNGGDGTNRVDVDGASAKATIGKTAAGQSIFATGGAGSDTVRTTVTNLTFKGGIEFAGGDGTNTIDLVSPQGTVNIGTLATKQSILFTGGAAIDQIISDLGHVTLSGGIQLDGGGGNNRLELDGIGFVKIGKFATGQSIVCTGTGDADNEIDLGGIVTTAGSVSVIGGSGSDDIDFDGKVSIGKDAAGLSVSMTGNDGDDDIDFSDNITLAGSLIHNGGNGADEADLDALDTLTIKGAVQFTGGAGADTFDLNAFSLVLGSTLTVTGGDDADDFHLIADGSVAGDVNVDLGLAAAGVQFLDFIARTGLPSGLSLKGALTVNATAAATIDSLTILNVAVAKLIDIKLGDGVSNVNIDNLNAGDEFKLDTRGGADVVNIERQNFFGLSVIKKLATILTGAGDDQLAIGNPLPLPNPAATPDSTRVNFIGGLTADGGTSEPDNRNDFGAQNDFGVPLTPPVNFEQMTIV